MKQNEPVYQCARQTWRNHAEHEKVKWPSLIGVATMKVKCSHLLLTLLQTESLQIFRKKRLLRSIKIKYRYCICFFQLITLSSMHYRV